MSPDGPEHERKIIILKLQYLILFGICSNYQTLSREHHRPDTALAEVVRRAEVRFDVNI